MVIGILRNGRRYLRDAVTLRAQAWKIVAEVLKRSDLL
jgi:hypothetical protein